jgi:CRP/FNR family transcriptional regulator, nitrogen oxide reductase regulator
MGVSLYRDVEPRPSNNADLLAETTRSTSLRLQIGLLAAGHLHIRFLAGLSKSERASVLSVASYRQFSRESVVSCQASPADRLFLLIKGSARHFFITTGGRKVYLLWLAPGELFGGASILHEPSSFLVSTEVTKNSAVLVWNRNTIRTLAARYPRLFENGLSIANDYLVWFLASHLSLICHSVRQRLAHVLLTLADGIGHTTARGIQLVVTNEQLANTANTTLFTVSRLLSEWQREGVIAKSRGRVLLRNPELLFRKDED